VRDVPNWDAYFLNVARVTASRSKDPITQVGAVIVNPDGNIVSQGFNGMPRGYPETHECWENKDDIVVHAEVNAIANAARTGVSTLGGTMYLTLPPCLPCARIVAAAGIKRVVMNFENWDDWVRRKPKWQAKFEQSLKYLNDAGVHWHAVRQEHCK
jgi:dCMP deaminase